MADPAKRRATYQDVLDAPEHMVAEIIDGNLQLFPRPAVRHSRATSRLGQLIGHPFDLGGGGGPGGWVILDEPELHFGEDIVVPDLAGWRRERYPTLAVDEDPAYLTIAPDWLCEALSPSTANWDRAKKLPVYAAAGVRHVWLVDARARALEVYRLHEGHWLLIGTYVEDAVVRAEPFDAIELHLGALWDGIPPPSLASEAAVTYRYF